MVEWRLPIVAMVGHGTDVPAEDSPAAWCYCPAASLVGFQMAELGV